MQPTLIKVGKQCGIVKPPCKGLLDDRLDFINLNLDFTKTSLSSLFFSADGMVIGTMDNGNDACAIGWFNMWHNFVVLVYPWQKSNERLFCDLKLEAISTSSFVSAP